MRKPIRRRDFLRFMAVTVVASSAPLSGCGDDDDSGGATPFPDSDPDDVAFVFPQGLASGDPRPDSVVLWTRVEMGSADVDVEVLYQIAEDADFARIVVDGSTTTDASRDYTVKIKPTNLDPFRKYYYRFRALDVSSDVGETKTAPLPDDDVDVRFAFASCQDFSGRYYHAWRALVDEEAPVDFVVHLGDYIYETAGEEQFQTPTEDRAPVIPDGQPATTNPDGAIAAATLADYRALYRQYKADADLKEAHRRYPFVVIWDDHEFSNDCWGDHATYFNELDGNTEEQPERREAANQAWFEFIPADVPFDENASYPDDITIYRTLRYGRHVELFMTDQRFYRADHAVPEGPPNPATAKVTANSALGARNFALKAGFDEIEAGVAPTMLGATQKQWLIDGMHNSDATWKIWGNEVQLWQMALDLSGFPSLPDIYRGLFYFTLDQWDGYRTERREILEALQGVDNLVAITGDIHAFFAAELHPDFDNPSDTPVGVEYVCAGISSLSVQGITQATVAGNPLLVSLGLLDLVPMTSEILLSTNGDYLRHVDPTANGIAIMDVRGTDAIEVTFLRVSDVTNPSYSEQVIERARFRTGSGTNRIEPLDPA